MVNIPILRYACVTTLFAATHNITCIFVWNSLHNWVWIWLLMRQYGLVINQPWQYTSNNINMPSLGYSCILSVHISMQSWISSLSLACTLIKIIKLIQSCILSYTYQAKMSLTIHKSEVDERWSRLFLVQPLSVVFSLCSLVPRPPQFLTSVCVQERA